VSSEGNEVRRRGGGGGGALLEGTLLEAPAMGPSTPAAARWVNVSWFKGEEKTFIQLEA
jgi:hypothetical protein